MLACNLKLEIRQQVLSIFALNDFTYDKINDYIKGYLWCDLKLNSLR